MVYGQRPGQDGEQGQGPGNDGRSLPPQWGYGQQDDAQGPGGYGQWGYDERGQQAGGDGRWQPPEWPYGQQPYEQGTGQRGYAPGQPTAHFQPVPPSQPGQRGFGPPGPQPPYQPPRRGKSWPARHKALTGLLAFGALIVIIVAANAGKSPSSPASSVAAGKTTTASATATEVHSQHGTQPAPAVQKTSPKITQTTPAASHAPAPSAPAPSAPAPTTAAAVVAPPASAAPASCHPLTNGGNCYEPGEFCRGSDHGASGVAGDGKAITCEDNDGWRWEPA